MEFQVNGSSRGTGKGRGHSISCESFSGKMSGSTLSSFLPKESPHPSGLYTGRLCVLLRDSVAQGGALVQQELSCPSVKW